MSQCAWVALVRDRKTGELEEYPFRYWSFAPEDEVKESLQDQVKGAYMVLEVSKNPYKYKEYRR